MVDFGRWLIAGLFLMAFLGVGGFATAAWSHGEHGMSVVAWAFALLQWIGVYFALPSRRVVVVMKAGRD